jgi:adenine deaminase
MQTVDAIIRNGRLVSVSTREIVPWDVAIAGGHIACMGPELSSSAGPDTRIIDAGGRFLVPGLIDAHTHYEMSMMSAVPFAEAVLPRGTTGALIDCHDMVNVMGMEGLRLMIEEAQRTPFKAFFTVPPCVPSSPGLEDTGCEIRLKDVQLGASFPNILGVAEAMDFNRILACEPEMMRILHWARGEGLSIDGHCPEVRGAALCTYIASGPIRTDHESTSVEEQVEKLRLGMKVILRRGSISEPTSAGELVVQVDDTSSILLSTDGCIGVSDILNQGHMDWAVRQLISEGVDPLVAIQMATINVAQAYGLDHRIGLIAPGRAADILLVDDLEQFSVSQAMVNGSLVEPSPSFPRFAYPAEALRAIDLAPVSAEDLEVHAPGGLEQGEVEARVIHIVDGALATEEHIETLAAYSGSVQMDVGRDILKVAVFERYGGGTRSVAFLSGFGLRQGALAGSIGQDAQNIVVVGASETDMALAVNRIRALHGGVVLAAQGQILEEIELPIGGIMTDVKPASLAAALGRLEGALRGLGCELSAPVFALSLQITLIVIPELKLSNRGLVNASTAEFVSLFV